LPGICPLSFALSLAAGCITTTLLRPYPEKQLPMSLPVPIVIVNFISIPQKIKQKISLVAGKIDNGDSSLTVKYSPNIKALIPLEQEC
jgi:hypothetical protein